MNIVKEECPICLERIYFRSKKLECKHVFHSKCIKKMLKTSDRRSCPLCMRHILQKPETSLLNQRTTEAIEFSYTIHEKDIVADELLIEALKAGNWNLINFLLNKVDLKQVVTELIDRGATELVKTIISTNKINFHSTKNGQSLIDRAFTTNNPEMINVIMKHCGFHLPTPSTTLYPVLPSAPFE